MFEVLQLPPYWTKPSASDLLVATGSTLFLGYDRGEWVGDCSR